MARIEVISGLARRRRWSLDDKRRIVGESLRPGAVVTEVARRHQVAESCLYAWRQRFREELAARLVGAEPSLLPVEMVEPMAAGAEPGEAAAPSDEPVLAALVITLPDGLRLEADARSDPAMLGRLVAALRRA